MLLKDVTKAFDNLLEVISDYKKTMPEKGIPNYAQQYAPQLAEMQSVIEGVGDHKMWGQRIFQFRLGQKMPSLAEEAKVDFDVLREAMQQLTKAIKP